jgi:hypothetical protein
MAELTPGREMDAAVAREIGWKLETGYSKYPQWEHAHGLRPAANWMPSTRNEDALIAANELLAQKRIGAYAVIVLPDHAEAKLYNDAHDPIAGEDGKTLAEAICAAILALEAHDGR